MRRLSLILFFGLAVLFLLAPVSARAQWGAGQCLVPGLRAAAVIESCRDALNIDPTHPEVLYKIGWALTEMGAHLEAVESYREASGTSRTTPRLTSAWGSRWKSSTVSMKPPRLPAGPSF